MKKHILLFLTLFFITIGFATVNTTLETKGKINLSENLEDFKIEITNLKINDVDQKILIANDKHSFTFLGTGNDTLNYEITNYSYQYDSTINLVCNPSEDTIIEQIGELEAQSSSTKLITTTNTNNIACRIDVEKISRTEYADEICPYYTGEVWSFDKTDSWHDFIIPCNGKYKIELWGASGYEYENILPNSVGRGGYVKGNIEMKKNQKLYVIIGGSNTSYNGGGYGEAPGGGSTDIRLEDMTISEFDSLKSRIMVAAGGGGGGYIYWISSVFSRGDGGGLIGYDSKMYFTMENTTDYSGYGATQTNGGKSGKILSSYPYETSFVNGRFGIAGYGGYSYGTAPSSGGGGGYYGGGHGGHTGNSWPGGGGGSSFISGHSGCNAIAANSTLTNIIHTGQPNHYSGLVFTDTVMIDGAGYNWTNVRGTQTGMPTHDGTGTMIGNTGNGYAKITYLGDNN